MDGSRTRQKARSGACASLRPLPRPHRSGKMDGIVKRVAVALLLVLVVAGAAYLLNRPPAYLAELNGDELAAHIRARDPDLKHAVRLIVPFASREGGETEREALVHALAAGPSVAIYEPAATALEQVGQTAVPTLRVNLRRDQPWIMRYCVIMLGRLARADDEETIAALRSARADAPGGYHIEEAVDAALGQIATRIE